MKTVLIYRNDLLPPSETFIRAQAESLLRYKPHFVGLRAVSSSLIDLKDCTIAARSSLISPRLQTVAYDYLGLHRCLQRPAFLHHLRALHPALLHVNFATDALTAFPLAQYLNIPMIVSMHGYDVTVQTEGRDAVRNVIHAARLRKLQRKTSLFLCTSRFIREKAIAKGFPAENTLVHYLGIDTNLFRPTRRTQTTSNVVFVARLTEKKGCEDLIRAMHQVQRSVPMATLFIIGDGHLRTSLQALAEELGVRCQFLGCQDYASVQRYMATARVFCVPSITAFNGDSEGLGMVFVEAQALGIPVCSTLHGGIPEVVLDGRTGLLSKERDVRALASNIVRLLTDDALHRELSSKGREFVEQRFNLQDQGERLEALYDEVISSKV